MDHLKKCRLHLSYDVPETIYSGDLMIIQMLHVGQVKFAIELKSTATHIQREK